MAVDKEKGKCNLQVAGCEPLQSVAREVKEHMKNTAQMSEDIAVMKSSQQRVEKFLLGNGQEGAITRLTRTEEGLKDVNQALESNSKINKVIMVLVIGSLLSAILGHFFGK